MHENKEYIWAINKEDGRKQFFEPHVWEMMPDDKFGFEIMSDVPESVKAEMAKAKAAKETDDAPEAPIDPAAAALAKAKAAKEQ